MRNIVKNILPVYTLFIDTQNFKKFYRKAGENVLPSLLFRASYRRV